MISLYFKAHDETKISNTHLAGGSQDRCEQFSQMKQRSIYLSLFLLMAFLHVDICYSQVNSAKPGFRLLTYGEPSPENYKIINFVGQRWGIEFYSVAGCVVTKELRDSVKQYNDDVELLISQKHGKDWRVKFDKEVATEFENERIVFDLIEEMVIIKEWKDRMQKENTFIYYQLTPIPNSTKYKASIKGMNSLRRDNKTYYTLFVDYRDKSVSIE